MNDLLKHAIETDNSSLANAVVQGGVHLCKLNMQLFSLQLVLSHLDKQSAAMGDFVSRCADDIDQSSADNSVCFDEIQRYTVEHPEFGEAFELVNKARLACDFSMFTSSCRDKQVNRMS